MFQDEVDITSLGGQYNIIVSITMKNELARIIRRKFAIIHTKITILKLWKLVLHRVNTKQQVILNVPMFQDEADITLLSL